METIPFFRRQAMRKVVNVGIIVIIAGIIIVYMSEFANTIIRYLSGKLVHLFLLRIVILAAIILILLFGMYKKLQKISNSSVILFTGIALPLIYEFFIFTMTRVVYKINVEKDLTHLIIMCIWISSLFLLLVWELMNKYIDTKLKV